MQTSVEDALINDLMDLARTTQRTAALLEAVGRHRLPAHAALHFGCARSAVIHAEREFERACRALAPHVLDPAETREATTAPGRD